MNEKAATNEQLNHYASRWGLELEESRQIETPSSVVAFGRQGQNPIALKLIKPQSDEHHAWRWLQHHAGRGAVTLLDFDSQALLLEQAVPGSELVELVKAGRDDEATRIVCQVINKLHTGNPALPSGFPMVEHWGKAFERNSREPLAAKIPLELLERAYSGYQELCAGQGPRYLLHGDLHHYNILLDASKGWRAIDPKGVVGELAYETGAMLRNPIEMPGFYTDPLTISRRVKLICQELGLDERRVLGWCFAQAILSAIWTVEDGGSAEDLGRTLRLAEATLTLLQKP